MRAPLLRRIVSSCSLPPLLCAKNTDSAEYLDTTIILDSKDTTFKDTLVLTEADSTEFSSSDGGKTWTVETINIHEHTYNL